LAADFFDSSALSKRYHQEDGSARVADTFLEPARRIIISGLTVVEMRSMFAGKVRAGVLTPVQVNDLVERFKADVASGIIEVFAVTEFNFQQAENLIGRYGFEHRLSSLDALQLAVALDLREQGIVKTIVAADKTLIEVAAHEGLSVLNPTG
jgi:predicted nucleic acid-binding protein